jgi:hypothetical protein
MEMEEIMERLLADIDARIDTNMKAMLLRTNGGHRSTGLKEDMKANQAKMDVNLEETREIKSGQAEMISIVNAWRVDMKDD